MDAELLDHGISDNCFGLIGVNDSQFNQSAAVDRYLVKDVGSIAYYTEGTYSDIGGLDLLSGDLDWDGDIDVVAGNYVFLNEGNGQFGEATLYSQGYRHFAYGLADFDRDGVLDIVGFSGGPFATDLVDLFLGKRRWNIRLLDSIRLS